MYAAIFTATLGLTAGDVELLQFTSPYCPACQTMAPIVERLADSGVSVKKIDIEARADLARQFRVTKLPTTVVVRQGREINRVEGVVAFDRLVALLDVNPAVAQHPTQGAAVSLPKREPAVAMNPAFGQVEFARSPNPNSELRTCENRGPQNYAFEATVRLKIVDGKGHSLGTGTIIDRHGDEACVMTCAHIFRASQGKGEIYVDLFTKRVTTVKGQLIDSDLHRDVALIAIRPGIEVPAVAVAGPEHQSQVGERVFSIGCNKGEAPTVMHSEVSVVNKFNGRPNVAVKGQPIDGRSGGGLFTEDGRLIGICNAADSVDDEGIYASLPAIHWQLEKIGQKRIFERGGENPASKTEPIVSIAPAFPNKAVMPQSPRTEAADDMEIFCVVRSKSQPHLPPQSFPLDRLPPEIAARLAAQSKPAATFADERLSAAPGNGLIIRGQQ